jgi:CRP/FNR family cyclic AMP-dependent transcriptional regulator
MAGRMREFEGDRGMDQKESMLAKVPLFSAMKGRELAELARNCDEIDVQTGRVLAQEGKSGQEFFVLIDGRVGIDRGGAHLRDLGPGDFFGELALLSQGPRTATATALTDSRLLVLTRQQFNSLLVLHPPIQEAVLESVAERLARLEPDQPN